MPIQLHCDICRTFIKFIDPGHAKKLADTGEKTICTLCDRAKQDYIKKCEKVLAIFQKQATQMRVDMEKQFLEVMRESMEV
ncbi:MAG: hypothetical protein BV459_09010, partial [Thermoplasmata archaeon M11B2D]